MFRQFGLLVGIVLTLATGIACGPAIDLKSFTVTDLLTGWYDFGVVGGQNKLVPSIGFRLQNGGTVPATEVDLTVSFWVDGADGEWDSKEVAGIGQTPVAPGAASSPILVRADAGYTSPAARAEFFDNPAFKDATAKVFAKRNGKIVPIGEFKIDRRVLPHVETSGRQ